MSHTLVGPPQAGPATAAPPWRAANPVIRAMLRTRHKEPLSCQCPTPRGVGDNAASPHPRGADRPAKRAALKRRSSGSAVPGVLEWEWLPGNRYRLTLALMAQAASVSRGCRNGGLTVS